MFILSSAFTIGQYSFFGCNDVKVSKSIHEYADKCVIKLPTSAVLTCEDATTESVQTAKTFNVGDAVSVRLGYNGNLGDEFIGFVSNVNFIQPCEIECEGYSWQLRRKVNIKKSWASTTLLDILQYITDGTDIALSPFIPDVPLKNIVINNASGTQVLDYLKSLLKGALTAFFQGNVLYMGLTYADVTQQTVKHQIGWNTIDSNSLKYKRAQDTVVTIQLNFRQNSGQMVTTTVGKSGGVNRTETINTISDTKTLQAVANAKLLQESYDGYEGTLTTFLLPYCQPGYTCALTDPKYPERAGNYFVESVETSYGLQGARRAVGIGIKL